MSEYQTVKVIGKDTQVKQPEGSGTALITDYSAAFAYLEKISHLNDDARQDFYNTLAEDPAMVTKAKKWNRAGREMVGLARTLLSFDPADERLRKAAAEIADQFTKEAAVRFSNLSQHYDLLKKSEPNSPKTEAAFDGALFGCHAFTCAAKTQQAVIRQMEKKNGEPVDPELEAETVASERAARRFSQVPEGHNYWPARPYPPVPFPADVEVPAVPRVFERVYEEIEPEIMEYDEKHDEFLVPKGYVSEDGLIDDESVVYNWEDETVTMKYRGGVPVTWPFWKPKNARDVLPAESWPMQYSRRSYLQWKTGLRPGLLRRRPEEGEIPVYDRVPENGKRGESVKCEV